MRKHLRSYDLPVLTYISIVTFLLLLSWSRVEHAWVFLAYHIAVVALIGLLLFANAKYGGRFWNIVRQWYPLVVVLASFREIHYLVPQVHPFDNWYWDEQLFSLDGALFGDVGAWVRTILWAPAVDVLSLCYWMYFPLATLIVVVLWRRGDMENFREMATVLMTSYFVSYLGYYAIPAVGPHLLEERMGMARDAAWDGVLVGAFLHKLLLAIEWQTPDAFPSGHSLVAMVCVLGAWRYRILVPLISFVGTGIVLATIYLRYHYIVDVITSGVLLPAVWWGGQTLYRRWEKPVHGPRPAAGGPS